MLMRQVERADRPSLPQGGQILDEGIVAARVAPALDSADVGAELAHPRRIVGPHVSMTSHPVSARIGFRGANVESRRAIDGFLERGRDSGEFCNVVAPFRANDGFAVARGDAAHKVVDECGVTGGIRRGGGRWSAADDTIGVGGVVGILLLKVHEAFGGRCRVDAVADLHSAR